MSSRLRSAGRAGRAAVVAATAAAALGALTGCGSGYNAFTNQEYDPTNGAQAAAGDLLIRNAQLVAGDESGTAAALVAAVVNRGDQPDALVGISIGRQRTESTLGAEGVEVEPGQIESIGGEEGASVTVYGEEGAFKPGDYVTLDLEFREAGIVSMPVYVDSADEEMFEDLHVSPKATTSPGAEATPAG